MDCCFEASILDFGHHHFVFLEPDVTIFGREGRRLCTPDDLETTELAAVNDS